MTRRPSYSKVSRLSSTKVPINPGVSVLGVLKHLNYKEWFAIAEFVDNAVQSFRANRDTIAEAGSDRLTVRIFIDDAERSIRIEDDAAGIPLSEFSRAFRPAHAPKDATGLSEFGMGMKSAACWFAPRWSVRTKALGEAVERTVEFDVEEITDRMIDELDVEERAVDPGQHYTVVELRNVKRIPKTKTLGKIRDHLADIYRQFLREGWLTLEVKGEALTYDDPAKLRQPPEWDKDADPVLWSKRIDFRFGNGKAAHGFAALFETGRVRRAGFALFRRGRLIQGSADEGFKPYSIFGGGNSYRSQRLFGEIDLEGFDVSHTKDGFQWDEDEEEAFLDLLEKQLSEMPLNLLKQADDFRARKAKEELEDVVRKAAEEAVRDVQKGFDAASQADEEEPSQDDEPPDKGAQSAEAEPILRILADEVFCTSIDGKEWEVRIQPTMDASEDQWLRVLSSDVEDGTHKVLIRVSAHHPFNVRFVDDDERTWQAILRAAAAMAIAKELASMADETKRKGATATLRNLNKAMREMGR